MKLTAKLPGKLIVSLCAALVACLGVSSHARVGTTTAFAEDTNGDGEEDTSEQMAEQERERQKDPFKNKRRKMPWEKERYKNFWREKLYGGGRANEAFNIRGRTEKQMKGLGGFLRKQLTSLGFGGKGFMYNNLHSLGFKQGGFFKAQTRAFGFGGEGFFRNQSLAWRYGSESWQHIGRNAEHFAHHPGEVDDRRRHELRFRRSLPGERRRLIVHEGGLQPSAQHNPALPQGTRPTVALDAIP